jgi:hypothetical protein
VCIYSEVIILKYPSAAVICKGIFMEGLCIGTMA